MVKNKRTLAVSLLVGFLAVTGVEAQNFNFGQNTIGEIEAMAPLPSDGFNVIQAKGKLILVSKDGHYAIKGGRIFDAWNGLEVKTMADLEKSKRIPKKFRELPFEKMGVVSIGKKGAKEILVFLDPTTSKGKPIIDQLIGLSAKYLIRIMPIPARDEDAVETQRVICLSAKKQLLYLKGKKVELPEVKGCDKGPLMRNVVTAMAIKVKKLPVVISTNGAKKEGEFDVEEFISSNK